MKVEDEDLYLQIPLVGSPILPLTLNAVLELGVFEILVKGCVPNSAGTQPVMMTADDIVLQLPTKNHQVHIYVALKIKIHTLLVSGVRDKVFNVYCL